MNTVTHTDKHLSLIGYSRYQLFTIQITIQIVLVVMTALSSNYLCSAEYYVIYLM